MTYRGATFGCLATLVASSLAGGCSSFDLEQTPAFRTAQRQLAESKQEPAVRRHGAVFLKDAERTLDRAMAAGDDPAQANHLVYLAQRKIEIARSITGLQVAAANLEALADRSVAADAVPPPKASPPPEEKPMHGRIAAAASAGPLTVGSPAVKPATDVPKPEAAPRGPEADSAAVAMQGATGAALEDALARKDPRGAVFVLSGISLAANRIRLTPEARRSLAPLVRYLRDNRGSRIIVEGYTGGRGSHEVNLSRSLGVADAVKSYLTGEGIEGARIFTLGRGTDDRAGGGAPEQADGRIEIGLFQGIGDPAPALSSRSATPGSRPSPHMP